MNVVGYCRVSTDRQAEDGLGLDVQREGILTWSGSVGHFIRSWHSDEGISGSNGLDTREGLGSALESLKSPEIDGIVVYRLDRLARDLMIQEQILAGIWRLGAEVFSVSPTESQYLHKDDPTDPARKFIRQVLGAVSEYERSMIGLRLQSGRKRKAMNGGYAFGAPPYGFKTVNGKLVPLPMQQAGIKRIVALREQGLTLRAIAQELEESGIPPRRGAHWSPETIRGILKREG